jgi:hypothetical protein
VIVILALIQVPTHVLTVDAMVVCSALNPSVGLTNEAYYYPNLKKGVPPATLAEFTLVGAGNEDYYDGRVVH